MWNQNINHVYKENHNSFIESTLRSDIDDMEDLFEGTKIPPSETLNTLGMVSNLYLYTNTPPHRYGSQAPKVAETINQAYSFNKKKQGKDLKINDYILERTHWEKDDGAFPFGETHGNFDAFHVKQMATQYLRLNYNSIRIAATQTIQRAQCQNSDILTKGRQTFDSFTGQSVTASLAYQRMYDFFVKHRGQVSFTCLEWIQTFMCLYQEGPSLSALQTKE